MPRQFLLLTFVSVIALSWVFSQPAASAQVLVPYPVTPQAGPGGPYYGTVGIPVTFTGSLLSSYGFGTTQFRWSFGDGAVAFGQTVSHTYVTPGTFIVTLTVIDPLGLNDTESTTAIIQPTIGPLQVNPGGPYGGAVGTPLTFTGTLIGAPFGGPLQYNWNFGDGTTAIGQTVPHIYTVAGGFPVTLTVSTPTQSAFGQTTATVTQALQVSAGVATTGYVGQSVPFAATVVGATSPLFNWTFGDGGTASGQRTSHVYQVPGTYTVTVSVVDTVTGQSASDTVSATINPSLTVDALGPYRGTAGSPITFGSTLSGATNPTYRWDFGDGTTGTGSSPTHAYQTAGTYTATLSVTDSTMGQTATDTASVSVTASGPVVVYLPGWNLVAGPQGTTFAQADSPLYAFRPGDTAYEIIRASAPVQAGYGYWAYFAEPTSVTLSGASTESASVLVPAGQFVLVGNPSATQAVTIHDATYALGWDPQTKSYKPVTSLAPGQAAWVSVAISDVVALEP